MNRYIQQRSAMVFTHCWRFNIYYKIDVRRLFPITSRISLSSVNKQPTNSGPLAKMWAAAAAILILNCDKKGERIPASMERLRRTTHLYTIYTHSLSHTLTHVRTHMQASAMLNLLRNRRPTNLRALSLSLFLIHTSSTRTYTATLSFSFYLLHSIEITARRSFSLATSSYTHAYPHARTHTHIHTSATLQHTHTNVHTPLYHTFFTQRCKTAP